ncbi:MAG: hypothetical protein WBW36_04060, partial [Candidatus Sulfotelmatobacter sp.]
AVERRIAALHHPHADLLKVGHHGSATSTTPEILAATKPNFAVISVGFHTSYGLPKPDVLTRLAAAGIHVYRTDLDGAVTFYLDGHSVTASLPTQTKQRVEKQYVENSKMNRQEGARLAAP